MKLIIPGAYGFVGSNFLDQIWENVELLSKFNEIVLVDILQYDQQIINDFPTKIKTKFIKGSIYNSKLTEKLVEEGDVVLHLAVEANTFDNPQTSKSDGMEKYLQILANKKLSKFIYLSSADIYGHNNSEDIDESAILKPTTLYAANKMAFEAYLHAYYSLHQLPAIILRPVTIFGPKQYPGWLIPKIITKALRNEQIQITGKGVAKRDWIYVSDVCDLLHKVIISNHKGIIGETYNLGTGHEEKVIDVTKYILQKMSKEETLIEFVEERPGDVYRQITRAKKAKSEFNWAPKVSFYEGIDKTIAYYSALFQ